MHFTNPLTLTALLLPLLSSALPNTNTNKHASKPFFYNGFDLSSLAIQEAGGYVYKDTARGNSTRPVEDILGDAGMNTVRLRLWVDPSVPFDGGYYQSYDLEYTLGLAKRFASKGYKIYLDYRMLLLISSLRSLDPSSIGLTTTQILATTGPTRNNNGSLARGPRASNPSPSASASTSAAACWPSTTPASTSPSSASATKSATA